MDNENRIMAGGLPEHLDIEEARVIPVFAKGRKLNREDRDNILALIRWDKLRDEIAVPLMNETKKGAVENKDSVNSFIHKSIILPEKLIDEAISDYFRKLGK